MHDGVWDRGDYIPLLFFKFTINFYEKLAHVGSEYSRNILNFIFLFSYHFVIHLFLLSFHIHHVVHLHTKLFYKLFIKNTKVIFYEKLAHVVR